jgi:branched-subunit amino acid ABC-type transport system permease component
MPEGVFFRGAFATVSSAELCVAGRLLDAPLDWALPLAGAVAAFTAGLLAAGAVALLETRDAAGVLVTLAVSLLFAAAALGAFTTGFASFLTLDLAGAAEAVARGVTFGSFLPAAALAILATGCFAEDELSAGFRAPDACPDTAFAAL